MIRRAFVYEDIQKTIYELLTKMTTGSSPWSRWTVVFGYPDQNLFEKFTKPYIYIMLPKETDSNLKLIFRIGIVRHG